MTARSSSVRLSVSLYFFIFCTKIPRKLLKSASFIGTNQCLIAAITDCFWDEYYCLSTVNIYDFLKNTGEIPYFINEIPKFISKIADFINEFIHFISEIIEFIREIVKFSTIFSLKSTFRGKFSLPILQKAWRKRHG
ncbi:hypothetical protein Barb7_01767 [Bacteroidales bacterium Barb7]|nr:hypothetical protein Barb7_01767 [Bacteroidales bacterium Barb7]